MYYNTMEHMLTNAFWIELINFFEHTWAILLNRYAHLREVGAGGGGGGIA